MMSVLCLRLPSIVAPLTKSKYLARSKCVKILSAKAGRLRGSHRHPDASTHELLKGLPHAVKHDVLEDASRGEVLPVVSHCLQVARLDQAQGSKRDVERRARRL
jgi:hypothetical protein